MLNPNISIKNQSLPMLECDKILSLLIILVILMINIPYLMKPAVLFKFTRINNETISHCIVAFIDSPLFFLF